MPTLSNCSSERHSTLNVNHMHMYVCVPLACMHRYCVHIYVMCTCTCVKCVTHLSAAMNMPLAAWDLSSRGQEDKKMSSSFIMERILEADTSAKERSNARLGSGPEMVNVGYSVYTYMPLNEVSSVSVSSWSAQLWPTVKMIYDTSCLLCNLKDKHGFWNGNICF